MTLGSIFNIRRPTTHYHVQ